MPSAMSLVHVALRVIDPPPGVAFALQRGADGLVAPVESAGAVLRFEFSLVVADPDAVPVRFTGEFAQGPPLQRFVYLCSGTRAGQIGSVWTRRAKIPLAGLSKALLLRASSAGVGVEVEIDGRARDGGPVCASVVPKRGWTLADGSSGTG